MVLIVVATPPAPSTKMSCRDGYWVIPDILPIHVRREHYKMPVAEFFGLDEETPSD